MNGYVKHVLCRYCISLCSTYTQGCMVKVKEHACCGVSRVTATVPLLRIPHRPIITEDIRFVLMTHGLGVENLRMR